MSHRAMQKKRLAKLAERRRVRRTKLTDVKHAIVGSIGIASGHDARVERRAAGPREER